MDTGLVRTTIFYGTTNVVAASELLELGTMLMTDFAVMAWSHGSKLL